MLEDEAPEEGVEISELGIANGAFVSHHVVSGLACAPDEVMVGIHLGQYKATCARLNYGYRVAHRYVDESYYWGYDEDNTQVPFNDPYYAAYMHGCLPNYFIQAVERFYGGEHHTCVSLQTSTGQALTYSKTSVDGYGPSSNGTQSLPTYNISPNMHVCPPSYAMAGLHVAWNDLYCGG